MSRYSIGGHVIDPHATLLALDRIDCAESLSTFVAQAWSIVEPGQPYVHGWHIDAMAEHLEAITYGDEDYNRLLINIPPGHMKSLMVGVFWPAWEWGPCNLPHLRYVCASHSLELGIRDSMRMRRLITSDWYQARWPHVKLTADQNQKTKFENTATGFRQAVAAGSITGSRGDRVIIDDPHSVEGAASDQQRATTLQWFLEAVPTRLNNPDTSAIVVIMQRLHEEDVSGVILDKQLGYDHLCLPMRATLWRRDFPTKIGFVDPRTAEGELLFPERFPEQVVARDERVMGSYATAGQFQQEPVPRGGGIIKRDWWKPYFASEEYPPMEMVVASLDTAYTEKAENDYSALTVWGVFSGLSAQIATRWSTPGGRLLDQGEQNWRFDEAASIKTGAVQSGGNLPSVMLMAAWQERLQIHDLVERVAKTCRRMQVDTLLIENKAAGHSVAQELRRLFAHERWSVRLVNPGRVDKVARIHSISHLFEEGLVYAPDKEWADMVIQQVSVFPRGKHDDLVDTVAQAMRHLRDIGALTRAPEWAEQTYEGMIHKGRPPEPIYPV